MSTNVLFTKADWQDEASNMEVYDMSIPQHIRELPKRMQTPRPKDPILFSPTDLQRVMPDTGLHPLSLHESSFKRRLDRVLSGDFRRLAYVAKNKICGVDFDPETAERYGLNPVLCCHHSNSGGPDLEAMLRKVSIPPGSRIVDFGCGKGGALLSFAKFKNFGELVGIEISPEMAAIAARNAERLKRNVSIVCSNAAQFTNLDRFTHFYFFNPSALSVIREIYQNILDSLDRVPRSVTLLCMYADKGAVEGFFPESARLRLQNKIEHGMSQPLFVFGLS